jgi:type IV secretion system protein VirB4
VGHTAVWGPTGAGKSTFLNLLEMQFFKYPGSLVVVFDKGRSCRQPCLAAGGLFYEPAGENPGGVSLQPLRDLETERELMDAMDFIESCFRVNRYEVTPPMRAAIRESLELLREKPPGARTLTSFVHYVNYLDPQTKKPLFNEQLGDYLWDGGKYGKIFDARSSDIRLCARFLAFEMEALMNRGEGCVVPALVYLFNLVEKMFDGRLTLLVLDEAWLFLRNPAFADKITEWLKVLRKKNVFVLFATQEVADVEKSPLKSTVIQQCLTKIYLADPSAATEAMADVYRAFGLTDAEIGLIASATMKRDYFYTSPLGRRLFRLDLGPLTLALTGSPDHALLDDLLLQNGPGLPLCEDILSAKTVPWESLLGPDEQPERPARPASPRQAPAERPQSQDVLPEPNPPEPLSRPGRRLACELLQAAGNLPERKKNDGSGRAACLIARQFGVSPATVYQVRRLLRQADPELLEDLRAGRISIKAACKRLPREKQPENPAAV